jgi:hypothetical protein
MILEDYIIKYFSLCTISEESKEEDSVMTAHSVVDINSLIKERILLELKEGLLPIPAE